MLAFFLAVVGLGAAALVLVPKLLGLAAGPESELIALLKQTEGRDLALSIAGASEPLRSSRHRFDRISLVLDPQAGTALVTATLDFDGKLGSTRVSSLGLERIRFAYRHGSWSAEEGFAPRLAAVVAALERRRRALEAGDLGRLASLTMQRSSGALEEDAALLRVLAIRERQYLAHAWYIRSERGEALVSEDFRLVGSTPDRPVDELGSLRLRLTFEAGEFFFSNGLM